MRVHMDDSKLVSSGLKHVQKAYSFQLRLTQTTIRFDIFIVCLLYLEDMQVLFERTLTLYSVVVDK